MSRNCEKCKYWAAEYPGGNGWCHRYPQTQKTKATYWCAEWTGKVGRPPKEAEDMARSTVHERQRPKTNPPQERTT